MIITSLFIVYPTVVNSTALVHLPKKKRIFFKKKLSSANDKLVFKIRMIFPD